MRLFTHNMLKCNVRGVAEDQGYPLSIECSEFEIIPQEFDAGEL